MLLLLVLTFISLTVLTAIQYKEEAEDYHSERLQRKENNIKENINYAGVKNILDWTPNKGNPFIIARANDPFDKEVTFDAEGNAVPTANNPYGLTFDPSYVYAPNQGRRLFFGLRYTLQ